MSEMPEERLAELRLARDEIRGWDEVFSVGLIDLADAVDEIDRLLAENERLMLAAGATGTKECPTCDGTGKWPSRDCVRCNGTGLLILIPGSYDPPGERS